MKIVQAELLEVEIPMRMQVEHALASRSVARNVLLKLSSASGHTGWGECCPRHYVTGETFEDAWEYLKQTLIPKLSGIDTLSAEETIYWLSQQATALPRSHNAAFCALELAVLDLLGQTQHSYAPSLLGPVSGESFIYSGVIATSSIDKAAAMAAQIKQFGVRHIKLKLHEDTGLNQALANTVRKVVGVDADLRGDANCAWRDADDAAAQLNALTQFRLSGIEQPLAADDLAGLTALTAMKICPVVVDESICSVKDAETLIERRACEIFNLRISKCGGLGNSFQIYQLADKHQIRCQIGAQVGETSCLSAAGIALSALVAGLGSTPILWREGCFGSMLLDSDLFAPELVLGAGGVVKRPGGPGFGIQIEQALLSKYQTNHWTYQPGG